MNVFTELFGIGMVFGFCGCFLPQIYKSFVTKNVEGVSVHMILLSLMGTLCSLGYSVCTTINIWNMVKDLACLSFTGILLFIYYKYKK